MPDVDRRHKNGETEPAILVFTATQLDQQKELTSFELTRLSTLPLVKSAPRNSENQVLDAARRYVKIFYNTGYKPPE